MGAAVVALFLLSASGKCMANIIPQFEAAPDLYISEGQSISLTVRASDTDGDPLSLSVSHRPSGAGFTDLGDGSGLFTWLPDFVGPQSSSASPFAVEFVVSDGLGQSSLALNVFVQNVNRAPVISVPDSVTVEAGDVVFFQPSVFDPDFERVTWQALVQPLGSSFDALPGADSPAKFVWQTSLADSGFASLTLVASDELGLADTTVTTIQALPSAAYILTISTDTVFPGVFLTLSVSLKNRDSLGAFDIALNLDPSVMAVLSVDNSASRTSNFELFTFEFDNPDAGDLRIAGRADVNGDPLGAPLAPGDGEIFALNLKISSQSGLVGLFLPVKFGPRNPFETFTPSLTRADDSNVDTADIELNNGGAKLKDESDISIGDININGIPLEIADALTFTNYFIDPVRYPFTPQQFANSDINRDGFTASIADLVALLGIIVSGGVSRRVPGARQAATIFMQQENLSNNVYVNSEADLGGALLVFAIDPEFSPNTAINDNTFSKILLSSELAEKGMLLKSNLRGDTLRVLIYSETSGAIASGRQLLFTLDYPESAALLVSAELATSQGANVLSSISGSGNATLPETFTLNQNYPNPFNPSTKITFTLNRSARVKLQVYDILGRLVRELVRQELTAGEHTAVWNGADDDGLSVASGVYVYRLSAEGQVASRKMTLLK